jgi:putative tryptophan/tyrosine transport system substrate-binding protein
VTGDSIGRSTKRLLAATLCGLLLPGAASGGEVAVLKSADSASWRVTLDALRKAAAPHTVTEYDLKASRAEAERILATLKGKSVVVVGMGPLAAQTTHEVSPDLPLVYCMVLDPAKAGLVVGPNVTGVSFQTPVKNQLAAFRLVYPRGVRIGALYSEEGVGRLMQEAQKAAPMLRLNIVARPLSSEREVPAVLRTLLKGDDAVDALWLLPDPALLGEEVRRHIMSETLKAGKPVYAFSASLVQEGALVSDGPDYASIGEQVGELVKRFHAGDRSKQDILVPRAELVINRKIAERLRIELPDDAIRAAAKTY